MKQHNKFLLILILAPFVFSFAFGLDIYVPIVPEMQRVFHTTPFMVQLTLSLFLLINGVGQLFIGPLSDQFGRHRHQPQKLEKRLLQLQKLLSLMLII